MTIILIPVTEDIFVQERHAENVIGATEASTQPLFACLKSTMKTLEHFVEYVPS